MLHLLFRRLIAQDIKKGYASTRKGRRNDYYPDTSTLPEDVHDIAVFLLKKPEWKADVRLIVDSLPTA